MQRLRGLLEKGRLAEALSGAQTLLGEVPENRDVLYILAVSQRYLQRIPEALATLARCESLHPGFSRLYQERGHCYLAARDPGAGMESFLAPCDQYRIAGELEGSGGAVPLCRPFGGFRERRRSSGAAGHLRRSSSDRDRAVRRRRDHAAENMIREFLLAHPHHVEAMRLLAQIGMKLDILDDAEFLLETA